MAECVLPHMAGLIRPGAKVIFLDTGYHFAETLGTADAVESLLPISLIRVRPPQTVAEQDAEHGKDLWARNPDLCCKMRNVQPLRRALKCLKGFSRIVSRQLQRCRTIKLASADYLPTWMPCFEPTLVSHL